MPARADETLEWLEADGLGGFASGTVAGVRTRRYHALLLAATTPPTGRMMLVNGFDAWVQTAAGQFALSAQRYTPNTIYPDGASRMVDFSADPWPRWRFRLDDGSEIEHELFVPHGHAAVVLAWRRVSGSGAATLRLRPFLSGRDYHGLHHENPAFDFTPRGDGALRVWTPYPGVPAIASLANAVYSHEPSWYRHFLYSEEQARGLDAVEDLASPGVLSWDLAAGEAVWVLASLSPLESCPPLKKGGEGGFSDASDKSPLPPFLKGGSESDPLAVAGRLRDAERARRVFPSRLHRAADAYLVRRGDGQTIIAGYPWFTDWGRDTFIALRGLCLAGARLDAARAILLAWAGAVSEGMLPNRFADRGETPEFNAVDASLWYAVAVHEYLAAAPHDDAAAAALRAAVDAILHGYANGTRFGIRADADGLLAAGVPGVQLTWMDARVGDWVVTPRIGKPVEVQALWLNALAAAGQWTAAWTELLRRGRAAFAARFWNAERGCLYDVVDVDHQPGTHDAALRPNQILAVGGLPIALLDGARARQVVDAVEQQLWTPLGLRSLAAGEPGYTPHYGGDGRTRDAAYHQGTVWPWLLGPFVEAWLRVRGGGAAARAEARERFLAPLLAHLDQAGLGHVSEIADGDPPHAPRGCPFQAWSVGEALRLQALLS
ncbi:MAG: amylo-alpha-1,6-glucosidase [Deltaproteobacteria bacterium]|nr:amylo-alpha-1,6-glucosidase [Deltaproteobacteria bacterium]